MADQKPAQLEYETSSRSAPTYTLTLIFVYVLVLFIVSVAGILIFARDFGDSGGRFAGAIGIVTAYLARTALRRSLLGPVTDADRASEKAFKVGTWALAAVLTLTSIVYRTCPHGTIVYVGNIGVGHSNVGGPCRNGLPWTSKWHVAGEWYICVRGR